MAAEQGVIFFGNKAVAGAGGGVYCGSSVAAFDGCNFTANEAVWGGGLALFSSGSIWDKDVSDSGPANASACVFAWNSAVDGGAMYSAAGYDMIESSLFEDNSAEGSGGAYLHSGVLVELDRSTFVRNRARDAGLAVQSLGIVENILDTAFESNTYYCSSGEYGYEDVVASEDEESGSCRFEEVCSGCAPSCQEIPASVDMIDGGLVPACEMVMAGVDASGNGMNVSTLNLTRGYWRTSAESRNVLKCYQENACVGGVDTSRYCEEGYQGAYCAVCDADFASGYQYSCSSCVGENKRTAIGVSVVLCVVALAVIALVIADLVRVVEENSTKTASQWEQRMTSFRDRMVDVVPLTSIKIVVVAWQIVTQFSSVVNVVYPDVYERFLSVLNVVNLNLGFILSVSCIVDTNFYGRLVLATIGPLVMIGALAVAYTVARSRNRLSPAGLQAAKSKHLSIMLFVMFVLYSSVSFNIFQTFVCDTLDTGVAYLRADYSLTCHTGTHTAMRVYAGFFILVYPVGIPAFYAWWLLSNRRDLVKVGANGNNFVGGAPTLEHLQPMRDLWAPYKPRRYYFEVLECGRRIALTGLAAFLLPDSAAQVAIEVVLAAIFMAVSDVLSPFVDPFDAWLHRTGGWIIFLSMYLALLLKVDASDEGSQSQRAFSQVLIAAHVGMVLVVVAQAVLSVKRAMVAVRDKPIAKSSASFRSSFVLACEGQDNAEL